MKKTFIILGFILSIALAYEICGIMFSKNKVSHLCKNNVIPIVYSKKDWENWQKSVRAVAPDGVNNEAQRKLLEKLAHERSVSIKSYAGYPHIYPYSGVWGFREEIWINERKVASISFYQSQTEMGPIQSSIFGGNIGSRYSCIDNTKFYAIFRDLRAHEFVGVGNVDRRDYGWRW